MTIKNNKILKNKLNQVGKRPVHWKLQNIAKIKKNINEGIQESENVTHTNGENTYKSDLIRD